MEQSAFEKRKISDDFRLLYFEDLLSKGVDDGFQVGVLLTEVMMEEQVGKSQDN